MRAVTAEFKPSRASRKRARRPQKKRTAGRPGTQHIARIGQPDWSLLTSAATSRRSWRVSRFQRNRKLPWDNRANTSNPNGVAAFDTAGRNPVGIDQTNLKTSFKLSREHQTSNTEVLARLARCPHSMFDVRCSVFILLRSLRLQ